MLVQLKRSFWSADGSFYEVRNGAPVEIPESEVDNLPTDAVILSGGPVKPAPEPDLLTDKKGK